MKYSVQNVLGEEFGLFTVPELNPPMTAFEFSFHLGTLLLDTNDVIGVVLAPRLDNLHPGEIIIEDRIVVTFGIKSAVKAQDFAIISDAVSFIAEAHNLLAA
ncbi:MAG TPA: hypothetical protein VLG47_03655 [Candidatus Saccharimonadales bacterium]|nr:hypothetical protein [Candidatus Saccharimonadales bacterium]